MIILNPFLIIITTNPKLKEVKHRKPGKGHQSSSGMIAVAIYQISEPTTLN